MTHLYLVVNAGSSADEPLMRFIHCRDLETAMRALVQVLHSRWPDTAAVARRIGGGSEDVAVVNGLAMLLSGRSGVTPHVPVPSLWIAMVPECREVFDYQHGPPQVLVADSGHRLHLTGLRVQRVELPEGVEPPWAQGVPDDMPVSEVPEPVGGYYGRGRSNVPMKPGLPVEHDWSDAEFLAAAEPHVFDAPFAAQPGFVGRGSRPRQGYSGGQQGYPEEQCGGPVGGQSPAVRRDWPHPAHDLRATIAGAHDAPVSMGVSGIRQSGAQTNGHGPRPGDSRPGHGQGPVTKAELRHSVVVAGLANGKWGVWSGGHVRHFFDSQQEALASAEQMGLPVCLATADGITRVPRPVGIPRPAPQQAPHPAPSMPRHPPPYPNQQWTGPAG